MLSLAVLILLFLTLYNFNEDYNTLIVLGYDSYQNDSLEVMEQRVLLAIDKCKDNVDYVIFTGGNYYKKGLLRILNKTSDNSEAKIMRELWLNNPKECNAELILEENAVTTFSNALNSINLMRDKEIKSALVVSSENHKHAPTFFRLAKLLKFSKIKFEFYLN